MSSHIPPGSDEFGKWILQCAGATRVPPLTERRGRVDEEQDCSSQEKGANMRSEAPRLVRGIPCH